VRKVGSKFIFSVIAIIHLCLLIGCFNKGTDSKKLYFEPPERLIKDYNGMVEGEEVNWVWLKLGVRLRSYPSITIKPFKNLSSIDDQNISERLYQGLLTWLKENDITLSDKGEVISEGAVVDLKLDRPFIYNINPFYEKVDDLFLELELVLREKTTNETVCKIRHGTTGPEVDIIVEQTLVDLIRYFERHK
jgi:hypothetical protein